MPARCHRVLATHRSRGCARHPSLRSGLTQPSTSADDGPDLGYRYPHGDSGAATSVLLPGKDAAWTVIQSSLNAVRSLDFYLGDGCFACLNSKRFSRHGHLAAHRQCTQHLAAW
jgi:hypothetical protein